MKKALNPSKSDILCKTHKVRTRQSCGNMEEATAGCEFWEATAFWSVVVVGFCSVSMGALTLL